MGVRYSLVRPRDAFVYDLCGYTFVIGPTNRIDHRGYVYALSEINDAMRGTVRQLPYTNPPCSIIQWSPA